MAQVKIEGFHFSPDTCDFIRLLHHYHVEYVVTGGEAVIYYGYARLTGDVDFFYNCREDNARRLFQALMEFWEGSIPGIERPEELAEEGLILQFGMPPNRIDLINRIDGVTFQEAWQARNEICLSQPAGDVPIYYISLKNLITNKAAAGRPKDLEDLKYLKKVPMDE